MDGKRIPTKNHVEMRKEKEPRGEIIHKELLERDEEVKQVLAWGKRGRIQESLQNLKLLRFLVAIWMNYGNKREVGES